MADFNFYLNRQGVRGAKGAKGDKGDAPIISVDKQSANEFVLKVNNPDGTSIISPNLVGQQIQVTNSGDTVKYNRDTNSFYTGELDRATTEIEGTVRYATLADVDNKEGGAVVGTDIFAQAISNVVSSPDGSIIIDYDQGNEVTTLKIGGTLVTDVTDLKGRMTTAEGRIATLSTDMTNQSELLSMEVSRAQAKEEEIENNVTGINGRLTTAESEIVNTQGDVAALDADMATKQNKLVQGDNITLTENADGTTTISAASGELPSNIVYTDTEQTITSSKTFTQPIKIEEYGLQILNNTRSLRTYYSPQAMRVLNTSGSRDYLDFGYDYSTGLIGLTSRSLYNFDITLSGSAEDRGTVLRTSYDRTNDVYTIKSYNSTSGTSIQFLRDIDVDGQTIQVIDGKLHANFNEINGEISNVSSRVTSLEGQVGGISTTVDSNTTDIEDLKETKNDNIFDIGKFTVVGSPTITDDGVASGFSRSNYINVPYRLDVSKPYDIEFNYKNTTNANSTRRIVLLDSTNINYQIINCEGYNASTNKFGIRLQASDVSSNTIQILSNKIFEMNKEYFFKMSFTGTAYELYYKDSISNTYTLIGRISNANLLNANGIVTLCKAGSGSSSDSIDLKQFSITVDGEEVFNGLMSSTKPIYDKITTLNTNVSDFELETSNNFSAVNSALNEKANLSDLSKCAPLADFNRLSATVTALESQVGDISAVLDSINGEVI